MIFRQLFDSVSSTYTYLLADRMGGEALIVDPVAERADQYTKLIEELDLKLVLAVDTHKDTLVYPAHDYEGRTSSTIGEELRFNPRLQVASRHAYIDQMNALSLDPPRAISRRSSGAACKGRAPAAACIRPTP
jgi:glyoxylase-like metal-dependent hydrolase (beta-lactamase superfamily II)